MVGGLVQPDHSASNSSLEAFTVRGRESFSSKPLFNHPPPPLPTFPPPAGLPLDRLVLRKEWRRIVQPCSLQLPHQRLMDLAQPALS